MKKAHLKSALVRGLETTPVNPLPFPAKLLPVLVMITAALPLLVTRLLGNAGAFVSTATPPTVSGPVKLFEPVKMLFELRVASGLVEVAVTQIGYLFEFQR